LDYVLDWKPSWRAEEKRDAVAGAVRNLVLLNWVKAEISETMIELA
jgi:P2-related tail formation protein